MRAEEWPPPTMADWLARTRRLQVEHFGGDPARLEGEEWIAFVRNMVLGLIVEATEALNEVQAWKWWRGAALYDRAAFVEELVDVAHFLGALAVAADVTDAEWATAYAAKHEIVKQRALERAAFNENGESE